MKITLNTTILCGGAILMRFTEPEIEARRSKASNSASKMRDNPEGGELEPAVDDQTRCNKPNFSVYSPYYAEECNVFAVPNSAS